MSTYYKIIFFVIPTYITKITFTSKLYFKLTAFYPTPIKYILLSMFTFLIFLELRSKIRERRKERLFEKVSVCKDFFYAMRAPH